MEGGAVIGGGGGDGAKRRKVIAPGVILSGGSRQAMELRGPYDAANLATLFGMKDEHARAVRAEKGRKNKTDPRGEGAG